VKVRHEARNYKHKNGTGLKIDLQISAAASVASSEQPYAEEDFEWNDSVMELPIEAIGEDSWWL